MEPEYLDKVHGIMQGVYGDKFTLDVDTFKDKMINETQYRDKIYGIMQGVYGDKFTLDPKTFYNKVLESSKKKSQSEIGSQTTQLGGGSENAQYAFEPGFQGEKPFFQTLRPEDQQFQEEQQVSEKPKRVIYRGEGTREALETQFAPEVKKEARKATIVEATKPIAKEMGEVIKPTSKIQKLADLNYMNQNPDDFNATYYNVFKDEAEKSGDPEKYSKDLKDKYANDFIDEEFKEEFNIANELKYIEDKMKKEISSLQSNPNAKTPQGQEYIKNKINEYTQLIQSKTAKLDEVRKANNQKYQQRIDEIDNLFKTGESVMREDALNAEKNELMRKMKLIKLAENPEGLKQEVGEQEYNKIPGSTADEKLNNYLNTRLTIYDQFKEDALNAALDKNRFYGERKDRATKVYDSYMNLKGELKDLYYLAALKRYANPEDRSNFLEAAGEGFLGKFAEGAFNFDDVGKKHSENLQKIAQEAGIQYSDQDKSFIEYTSAPAEPWSSEWWGDMTGTSSAFMAELALTRKPTSAVLKAAGSALKAAPQMSKIAQAGLSRYDKLGKTGQKFVNTVFNAAEEGAYFEGANQMLHDGESSELTFLTGLSGGLLAAPVNALLKKAGGIAFDSFKKGATQEITKDALTAERAAVLESLGAQKDEVKTLLSQFVKPTAGKDAVYMISGTFGKQSPKVIDLLEKVGTHLIARPTGEVAQEFGEELASIYQETSNFEEFKKEFSARFPDADAATQFVVASYMMGVGFGGGNFIGDVFMKKSKQGYDALTPEQKKVADKAIAEADAEIKNKEAEVLNEQEMNTPAKEKSKEETDWDNTRVGIEDKISQSGNQISALENQKQKIYDKYGITDPKAQDISGLSNDDAIKIETINSEIQREKKAKSKEEINLSIHEDNKPVIEEAEESPMAVHADELINKNKENALQEPISESLLSREQGETTETGGQPQGMGQGVQGQEAPQEGQEVSQEDVEAKKADIEKRRQAELSEYTEEQLNEAYTVGSTDTIRDRINEKYDLEIDQQIQSQEAQKVSQDNIEDPKADIERRRQEELDSESGRIVESTEIWKDGEGRLYRIDKLKNGKQRLAVTNEEGKLLNVIDTYEGSVSPTLFIADGQKVKDQEVRENKIADKINAKYDAELAALESGNQSTQEGVEQQKAPEVQPTEQVAEQPTPQVQEEKQPFTGRSNQDRSLKEKYKADNLKRKILDQAQRIASALGNNTQVYIHETTDEYNKAIAERLGEDQKESTNGRFLYGDGVSEIHIDLSKANQNTLPHEAVHAVLYKAFGENEKLFQQFKDKLKPLLANSTVAELENFANQEIYVKQGVTSEEFLAELGGVMTAAGNRIPKTTLQKITQLLNEFLSKITGGRIAPLSTGEVIDLFNSMADAFASGQSIQSLMDSKGLVGSGKVNGNVKSKQSINTKLPEQQERTSNFSKVKEIKLSELNDKTGVLTGSDRLTTAVLKFPDGSTMVLKGGIFYPSETGLVWASTDISGATQLANKINEVIKQQGEAWLFPVNNSYGSQYSNYTFFEVGMRHLQYAVKTKAVNKDEIINKINQFKNRKNYLKSFKKDYKPKAFTQSLANKNLQQIYDLIHEDFIPENATYDGRKEFVKTFFGGKDTKSRVFKNVPNTSELIAMTTEPVNADVRDFTTSSVIKITGKVTPRETSKENDGELFHSSYPAILESSGNVESYVLDGTYNIEEVFPEFKNAAGKVVNWESVKKKIAKTGEDATYQNYKNTIISSQGAIPRAAKIKSKSQAPNLVEKAGISSNMTEDDQGNYLFYHYSPNKISSIDPRYFGRNVNRTGRDERPGMNISMYYTNPEVKDVSGDFGYVVRIPKDKVYPFNKDPLDLYDKAKEAFNKKFPGQAFDPNKQVAFISAEAAKLGYPMTVAKWGDNLRAQTTQKMVGEFYTKPAKGGGIDVNEDIAQFKVNKKARRSKLKSKSQIEVDPKQIQANSESKLNEVVNGDPESGATFNLDGTTYDGGGLVIPITSVNIDTDKISPKDISDMVEDNIDKIFDDQKVKTGIYKFTDGKQMSVDLNIIVPSEQVEFAKEFARAAGQESIFSLDTYENIKTGSTGENPVSFSAEEFLEIAEALNEGRLPNIERLEYKPEIKSKSQVPAIPKASAESKSVVSELETASNKTGLAKENAVKRFIEKYGEKGVVAKQISDNFDKIQEQLGITKICNI